MKDFIGYGGIHRLSRPSKQLSSSVSCCWRNYWNIFLLMYFQSTQLYDINVLPRIFQVLIGWDLLFTHTLHPHAVTHLKNVCQFNIRQGKKIGFQLSHSQPLKKWQKYKIRNLKQIFEVTVKTFCRNWKGEIL